MDFVKRNILLLASGLVGIASLAFMIWGITRMDEVTAAMNQAKRTADDLKKYESKPVGAAAIDNEYKRIETTVEYYDKMIDHFTQATAKTPILEGLLPDPPSNENGKQLKYDFRPAYKKAMDDLIVRLNAGQPPSKADIDEIADHLRKKEMERELTAEFEGRGDDDATAGDPAARGDNQGDAIEEDDDLPDLPSKSGPASVMAYWAALAERAQLSADMLAAISRAREIYCYATPFSFTLDPLYQGGTHEPDMEEVWKAQLWYWLQQDVVEILATVNDRAADQVKSAGGRPWVANMPIKDIRGVGVSGYIDGESEDARRNDDDFMPPSDPDAAFTHQAAHDLYDVINIRLQLVVDMRDVIQIIDALMHERYNTVFNVSYESVEQSLSFKGKIYGPEPLALVTIDLQTYLCYKSFVPFMPRVIREQRGVEGLFEELVGDEEDEDTEDEG